MIINVMITLESRFTSSANGAGKFIFTRERPYVYIIVFFYMILIVKYVMKQTNVYKLQIKIPLKSLYK